MARTPSLVTILFLTQLTVLHAADKPAAYVPHSVTELWSDFDPRKDPLETEIIREWKSDGVVLRSVRFLVGTFKAKPARMAAIYGFPETAKEPLPGLLQIHGGGGRASTTEGVMAMVKRGYAVLSVNWGGARRGSKQINTVEGAQPGDPNTDWGAVDPTQLNPGHMDSMLPGPKQFFEDCEHPKNANWYLITLGCRRGLTFLEQQKEVDPQRLGVFGFSMGGNLTMYVAGSDSRVKAAVPSAGGSGWRNDPHSFLGGSDQPSKAYGDAEVFRDTLGFESYALLIHCPLLHRSATNDFHGWMDDVYRTDSLIQGQPVRHSFSAHLDHMLRPETAATMPLFFDQYLKGGPALPEPPASELKLKTHDGIPVMQVSPKSEWPITRCEIYYSVDPDPRVRFWRSTDAVREGDVFQAKLPLHTLDLPLFAFANVSYSLPKPELPEGLMAVQSIGEIKEVCLSTALHKAAPEELAAAGLRATDRKSTLIESFAPGWQRDWCERRTNVWMNTTRKITDPKWRGPDGAKLALTLTLPETNRIAFKATENECRKYRGPNKSFVCSKLIPGSTEPQTIQLDVADFKDTTDGTPLKSWSQLDLLGITNHVPDFGETKDTKPRPWHGPAPKLIRLEWK